MFEIHTRQVPAGRLMSIQRRLHGHQTDAFVKEAKAAFRDHLGDVEPVGPFSLIFHGPVNDQADGPLEAVLGVPAEIEPTGLIFHGPVNDQADGPLEAVLGVPAEIEPTGLIGIRVEPAHDEAYTTITKRQWGFPAILAVYDAVASSPEVRARRGSQLSCREVYLAEPDAVGDDDRLCDIAFPLSDVSG